MLEPVKVLRDPSRYWNFLKATHLPYSFSWSLMRTIRHMHSPGEQALRKKMLGPAPAEISAVLDTLNEFGIAKFDEGFGPDRQEVVRQLAAILAEERKKTLQNSVADSRKSSFLLNLVMDSAFTPYPAVLAFMLDHRFLDLASHYLGEVPVLSSASLWLSPINTSAKSSQLYHFDEADDRQLKFFLNVEAVREENGPFTAVPATISEEIRKRSGGHLYGRRSDEVVASCLNGEKPMTFVGEKGALAAVDTSRCLHYGSRGNTAERVVLMFQYTRLSAPLAHVPEWGPGIIEFAKTLSPQQRRALQLT